MSPSIEMRDTTVRAIKPHPDRQVEYLDKREAGLALVVSPKGTKAWSMRYRTTSGKQRRISIGRFPNIGVAAARKRAKEISVDVANGGDPALQKRQSKAEAKTKRVRTVADLIESYFEDAKKGRHRPDGKPKRLSTLTGERDYFDRLIKPKLGSLAISELTRAMAQSFLDDVGDKSAAGSRQCRNVIRQAYNYAIRRDMATHNPAQMVQVAGTVSRDRVLTDDEIKTIWNFIEESPNVANFSLSATMGLALKLSMVTLQRGNEICGLNIGEIDFDAKVWTLPGERAKNHRTHLIPLSDLAISLIKHSLKANKQSSGNVFPSPRGEGEKPITRHAFTRACKRITDELGIEDARPQDFRRTGATNITGERIGMTRFIVSKALNHVSDHGGPVVTGVYDRSSYMKEKRQALEAWSTLLIEIVEGKKRGDNVVGINSAKQ